MSEDIKAILFLVLLGLFSYIAIVCPIRRWNCNRVGMDFAPFVDGCIVRQDEDH